MVSATLQTIGSETSITKPKVMNNRRENFAFHAALLFDCRTLAGLPADILSRRRRDTLDL